MCALPRLRAPAPRSSAFRLPDSLPPTSSPHGRPHTTYLRYARRLQSCPTHSAPRAAQPRQAATSQAGGDRRGHPVHHLAPRRGGARCSTASLCGPRSRWRLPPSAPFRSLRSSVSSWGLPLVPFDADARRRGRSWIAGSQSLTSLSRVSFFKRAVGILSPHALAFLPPRYWHSALDCTRVFTWIISHAGWSHLMGNLPTLLLLGPGLESEVQPPRVPPPQPESGNAQRRSRGAA